MIMLAWTLLLIACGATFVIGVARLRMHLVILGFAGVIVCLLTSPWMH